MGADESRYITRGRNSSCHWLSISLIRPASLVFHETQRERERESEWGREGEVELAIVERKLYNVHREWRQWPYNNYDINIPRARLPIHFLVSLGAFVKRLVLYFVDVERLLPAVLNNENYRFLSGLK
jgi:hypothetical protein